MPAGSRETCQTLTPAELESFLQSLKAAGLGESTFWCASSISRQYHAVWLICSKQFRTAARRNSQKLLEIDQTRQAIDQPKKSPSMVVNFRPSLSARIPPKKEKKTCTTIVTERIAPICTSVTPCVYI